MFRVRPHSLNAWHRRWAVGSAILVLMLGMMSASPVLHAWAHVHPSEQSADHSHEKDPSLPFDAEHSCVVAWFAQGVALAVDSAAVKEFPGEWQSLRPTSADEVRFASPRFLRPPGRGPPQNLS